MIKSIQSIRGMNDYLPNETIVWQYIEETLKRILSNYGYREIRLPIVEKTSLFKRVIGELTNVVKKEMYTFKDHNGDSLSLRPEGTAGCVRAGIEHGFLYNQEQRLWYMGPMFRHERPQKGRYRQFYQLGVEAFGLQGPEIDAELVMLSARWWKVLNITKYISLELNSIGSSETYTNYCHALTSFLERHKEKLDEDCKYRMYKNPLRILDSKNPQIQKLLNDAPVLSDYLDDASRKHFIKLCELLRAAGITYTINQRLVRGLDYYNRTVFEWVTNVFGSQITICAGGRYDGLVKYLGGNKTAAVGFAIGLERLILLIQFVSRELSNKFIIDIYLVTLSSETQFSAILLAEHIRNVLPKVKLITNFSNSTLKKQLAYANKLGARVVLILSESKITDGKVIIKNLNTGKQITVTQNSVITYLRTLFN